MFLPESKWSSRYETQFYTIRMNSYVILDKPPPSDDDNNNTSFGSDTNTCALFRLCNNGVSTKFPAVYYKIEVLRGNTSHIVLRRYSQFVYLCNKLDGVITTTREENCSIRYLLPPKTGPFHNNHTDEEFLEERMEGLYKFLMDILLRPECVNNQWIVAFLGLDHGNMND